MVSPSARTYVADRARSTLRVVLPASAGVLAVVGLVYLVAPPIEPGAPHALAAFMTVAGLLTVHAAVRAHPRFVYGGSLIAGGVVLADALSFLALTGDPAQSVTLVITLLGASFCLFEPASTAVLVVAALGGWGWLAADYPSAALAHWGINLLVTGAIAVVVSVSRQRAVLAEAATVARLGDSEEHHRLVVERALDAVITSDIDGVIVGWNAQAEQLFGWSAAEARGLALTDTVVLPAHREPYRDMLAMYRGTGTGMPLNTIAETTLVGRDGALIPVEFATIALRRGDQVLFTAWIRDITQRRQAAAATAAATKAKHDFLANMSHEIRTPIHGIVGMTDIALETSDDAERREVLDRSRACAETLLAIVNDVLDFSKIEADKLVLECRPMRLADVLDGVLDAVVVDAERKGLVLVGSIHPEVPPCVVGDAMRLRQVLLNLMANAVKFTDHGEVEVRIEPVVQEAWAVVLRLRVRDTGIGIPADKLRDVFDAFTQVEQPERRPEGGTGLGLAISRRLVELMGGTLSVESTPGLGSEFTCTLRLETVVAPEIDAPEHIAGLHVLIVDPNATRRNRLREQLGSWGCRVAVASDAAHASEQVACGGAFDVVLADASVSGIGHVARDVPLVAMVPMRWGGSRTVEGRALHGAVTRPIRMARLRAMLADVAASRRAGRVNAR